MTPEQTISNSLGWAQFFKARGWQPIPVPLHSKIPIKQNWPQLIIPEHELKLHFSQDTNLGVLLGTPSDNLVDIDLDCKEAIRLAPLFLPKTDLRFGRRSKPLSHWLYRCDPITATRKWLDTDQQMIVELRSSGSQTIFPGSIHESGELILFDAEDTVANVSPVAPRALVNACNFLAAAVVLAKKWPSEGGRHHAAMALSGWLLRSGKTFDEVDLIVSAVAGLAGDDEVEDRRKTVVYTQQRLHNGQTTTGLPTINELFGEAVTQKMSTWLGGNSWLLSRFTQSNRLNGATRPEDISVEAEAATVESLAELTPKPVGMLDFTQIKPRQWVLGTRFLRGASTVTIAPGGLGKSTLSLEEAVSIATGIEFLDMRVYAKGKVWVYNNEDPLEELHRRIAAICIKWNIPIELIADEVFLNSGLDRRLIIAQEVNGVAIATPDVPALIDHIRANDIKLLVVDPFVRSHRVNENSNDAIDYVAEQFTRIGSITGAAINLIHHTRKPPIGSSDGHVGNADSARGASSLISAARIAHTLMTMSINDAVRLAIPEEEAKLYVRLDDAKANFSAPTDRVHWFKREGVKLPNASSALGMDADTVGVLVRADLTREEKDAREREEKRSLEIAEQVGRLIEDGKSAGLPYIVSTLAQSDYATLTTRHIHRLIQQAVAVAPAFTAIEDGKYRLYLSVPDGTKTRYITKDRGRD